MLPIIIFYVIYHAHYTLNMFYPENIYQQFLVHKQDNGNHTFIWLTPESFHAFTLDTVLHGSYSKQILKN